MQLGGGQGIEEKYNLKHSNNIRLKRWSIYRGVGVGDLTTFKVSYLLYRPYLAILTPPMMHFVAKYIFKQFY